MQTPLSFDRCERFSKPLFWDLFKATTIPYFSICFYVFLVRLFSLFFGLNFSTKINKFRRKYNILDHPGLTSDSRHHCNSPMQSKKYLVSWCSNMLCIDFPNKPSGSRSFATPNCSSATVNAWLRLLLYC